MPPAWAGRWCGFQTARPPVHQHRHTGHHADRRADFQLHRHGHRQRARAVQTLRHGGQRHEGAGVFARDLAVANPINAAMGTSNSGTLQLAGLQATGITWNGGTGQAVNSGIGGLSMPPSPPPAHRWWRGAHLQCQRQFTLSGNANRPSTWRPTRPSCWLGRRTAYTSGNPSTSMAGRSTSRQPQGG